MLILSDVHLGPEGKPALHEALLALIAAHPGCELVFNGDTFEFSAFVERDPERIWQHLRGVHGPVLDALRDHVAKGGRLSFVAGNHDAAITSIAEQVIRDFTLADAGDARVGEPPRSEERRVAVAPWFLRRHGVHIEHGQLWDPDNAPLHPLADWSLADEPIGIALMRRFVAAHGVRAFAHQHESTPRAAIARAIEHFGWRTPGLLLRFLLTASALCWEASRRGAPNQLAHRQGAQRIPCAQPGEDPARLRALLARAPSPTHRTFADTFMRLYCDRVLASSAVACGGALALFGVGPSALLLAGGGLAYLVAGARAAGSRSSEPVRALREAGELVGALLDADYVVFGHTHVPEQAGRTFNTGSFAHPDGAGRPFVTIERAAGELRVQQRRWPTFSAHSKGAPPQGLQSGAVCSKNPALAEKGTTTTHA